MGRLRWLLGSVVKTLFSVQLLFFFSFFLNSHQSNLNADFVVAGFVLSDIFNVPLILHSTLYAPGKTPSRKLCEAAWQRSAAIYPWHQALWLQEFRVGQVSKGVLTKSILSKLLCVHLVPPPHPAFGPLPPPPPTLLLLLCQGALLFAGYCWRIFETRCSVLTLVHCTATMVHSSGSSICRLFLLVLLGLFIAFIHTGKAVDSIRQLMLKQVTVRFY